MSPSFSTSLSPLFSTSLHVSLPLFTPSLPQPVPLPLPQKDLSPHAGRPEGPGHEGGPPTSQSQLMALITATQRDVQCKRHRRLGERKMRSLIRMLATHHPIRMYYDTSASVRQPIRTQFHSGGERTSLVLLYWMRGWFCRAERGFETDIVSGWTRGRGAGSIRGQVVFRKGKGTVKDL